MGACKNYMPADLRELADKSGVTIEEVESFIIDVFGSVAGYRQACRDKTPLDNILALLNSDQRE